MDVGAGPCRVRTPRCGDCPAVAWCRYAAGDRPAVRAASATGATGDARPGLAPAKEPAFPSTTRWLRGRIVASARDADDGAWVPFGAPIGGHDRVAVREAVAALASEGLLETRETPDGPEGRLPGG